jgi:serine/threonine-protein kinase SRPK3
MYLDLQHFVGTGGYHPVQIGEQFNNGRYSVLRKLGWGHFSTVWLVADNLNPGSNAALKIVKSASHYTEAAKDEIKLLSCAKERDPEDEHHCCRLLDHFEHAGPHGRHVCMVFEVLGDNLLSLIRGYSHRGIPMPVVRHLTRQILDALDFLHTKCGIIHTDLKPENVMLKYPIKPREAVDSQHRVRKPVGKIEAALAAGQPLTKNQKKKYRKKLQKIRDSEANTGDSNDDAREDSFAELTLEPSEQEDEDSGEMSQEIEEVQGLEMRLLSMTCKVVDFGNACWVDKHFTEDIQTRQYRAPEVRSLSFPMCFSDEHFLSLNIWRKSSNSLAFEKPSGI